MDYRDIEKRAANEERGSQDVGFWWKATDSCSRAKLVCEAGKYLEEEDTARSDANLKYAKLYGGFDLQTFSVRGNRRPVEENQITLNVVASCVDALAAKVAKTKPRPTFLTDDGDYKAQRDAQNLDKFVKGLFYETDIYAHAQEVFFDGCTLDGGMLHVYLKPDNTVCFERAFVDELHVDEADARYGRPRQMFRKKLVQRETLMEEYGEDADRAAKIQAVPAAPTAYQRGFGDAVEVWECWHLPSGKSAGDGMHVIAIDGCELHSDKWPHDFFPFAPFRFVRRMMGFWGQGLAERLSGIQVEINRLLKSVSEQLKRKGRGRIFMPKSAGIPTAHIRNAIADIVQYNGNTPPVVDASNAVAAEEFTQIERLYQKAFQEAGISELSAAAKKPSGLDAAVALREFQDIESERFSLVCQGWDNLFMVATRIAFALLEEAKADIEVRVPGKRGYTLVRSKDLDLSLKKYVMQMYPVSSLPSTPAYRLQRVAELEDRQYIDKATARRLVDFPDIEAENKLASAALDDVDATLSAIMYEDPPRYMAPEEFQDLPLLLERATASYLRARHIEGMEFERLEMLIRLIDATKTLLTPPTPAGDVPGASTPQGPVEAPPMPMEGGGGGSASMSNQTNVNMPAAPAVPPLIGQ